MVVSSLWFENYDPSLQILPHRIPDGTRGEEVAKPELCSVGKDQGFSFLARFIGHKKNNHNGQGYPWWPAVVLPSEEGEWTMSNGGKFRCVFLQDNQSFK